jgi:hypothetical protein
MRPSVTVKIQRDPVAFFPSGRQSGLGENMVVGDIVFVHRYPAASPTAESIPFPDLD